METGKLGRLSNHRLEVLQCQVRHCGPMGLVRSSCFDRMLYLLTSLQALVDQITAMPLDLLAMSVAQIPPELRQSD